MYCTVLDLLSSSVADLLHVAYSYTESGVHMPLIQLTVWAAYAASAHCALARGGPAFRFGPAPPRTLYASFPS